MSRANATLSLLGWIGVGGFWLIATRGYHPSWPLAGVATASLVVAYAGASYVNHLILIPRYLRNGRPGIYAAALAGVMVVFTCVAIAVLRLFYVHALGLGAVNSLGVDFGLDFFGMAVHVAGAALIVCLSRQRASRAAPRHAGAGERSE